MHTITKVITVALTAVTPLSVQAGGLAPAVEETPVVIVEEPAASPSSVSNLIVPLIGLALVGLAVTASTEDGNDGAKSLITNQ